MSVSKYLEDIEEMFPKYYMYSDVCTYFILMKGNERINTITFFIFFTQYKYITDMYY